MNIPFNLSTPQYTVAKPKFGQLFIGEAGKVIVLEPKDRFNKGVILHQAAPNGPINTLAQSSVIDAWTKVAESYGPLFNKGSEGFYALTNLFRQSLWQNGILAATPAADKNNAAITLLYGEPKPFNGGFKLDYPA